MQIQKRFDDSVNLHSLETINLGSSSILTLEEALETVGTDVESDPFMLKVKKDQPKVIKIRKTLVNIDSEDRIIVIIRDLTDTIDVENMKM